MTDKEFYSICIEAIMAVVLFALIYILICAIAPLPR